MDNLYSHDQNYEFVSEKQLTHDDWITLAWGIYWRSVLVGLLSLVPVFILGFIIGILATMAGKSVEGNQFQIQLIGLILGAIFGFGSSFIFVKWLLKSGIGEFRLMIFRPAKAGRP